MKKWPLGVMMLAALSMSVLLAQQDLTGTWQGTLVLPTKQELRMVVKITKDAKGLKAALYSIDQTPQAIAAEITTTGSAVKFTVPSAGVTIDSKLDMGGTLLTGTFSQGGGAAIPLNLKHIGPNDVAWPMPEAAATPKAMAKDANPEFDACSIKPSKPEQQGQGITVRGRELITINTPISALISWVYGVHARQVIGAPAWMETERYDLDGKPAGEGMPSQDQWKAMIKKLLADRLKLTFHRDKKELSVYAIQIGKNGSKLTKSQADPNGLPGLGFRALGAMNAFNATMGDFASLLQSTVLDRPVVDQTELAGHFDFQLNWTPDENQFAGLGMKPPTPSDKPDAPPDLATAMQDQIGLKLVATKAQTEVLVIDHIEKPSAN